MGFFSRDTEDTSTPEQRAGWKERAEQQMAEQRGERQAEDQPRTHRRARRPE